jgi:hypothetical protein
MRDGGVEARIVVVIGGYAKGGSQAELSTLRGKLRGLRHQSVDEDIDRGIYRSRNRALLGRWRIGRAQRCCKTGKNHSNYQVHGGFLLEGAGNLTLAEAPDK